MQSWLCQEGIKVDNKGSFVQYSVEIFFAEVFLLSTTHSLIAKTCFPIISIDMPSIFPLNEGGTNSPQE